MNILEPILLGILQGILEWLPVSSEGVSSLVMMNFFEKSLEEAVFMSIWLHTGTLMAALVYFRNDMVGIVKNIPSYFKKTRTEYSEITSFLIISTLMTGIIGAPILLFGLDKLNANINIAMGAIGFLLIATGLLQKYGKMAVGMKKNPGFFDSLLIVIAQGFSALPGLSRSGLTTSAMLLRKYDAKTALKFSFLMSIPAVLVAELGIGILGKIELSPYFLVAITFSFVFGLLTIRALMKVAEKTDFSWFCIFLGFVSIMAVFV